MSHKFLLKLFSIRRIGSIYFFLTSTHQQDIVYLHCGTKSQGQYRPEAEDRGCIETEVLGSYQCVWNAETRWREILLNQLIFLGKKLLEIFISSLNTNLSLSLKNLNSVIVSHMQESILPTVTSFKRDAGWRNFSSRWRWRNIYAHCVTWF